MRFVVTGATGNTGVPVVKALSAAGHSVIAITRNTEGKQAQELALLKGVEVTTIDHAFDHPVDRVFITFAVTTDMFVKETDFLNMCIAAGVKYIVKIATYGLFMHPFSPSFYGRSHLAVEHFLDLSPIPFTSLRPSAFFNFLGLDINQAKETKGFKSCVSNFEVGCIDPDDIGKIASSLLLLDDPSPHYGKRYFLDGPERLTGNRMAEIASDVLKEKINFQGGFSASELEAGFKSMGIGEWEAKSGVKSALTLQTQHNTGQYKTDPAILALAPPTSTYHDYLSKLLVSA